MTPEIRARMIVEVAGKKDLQVLELFATDQVRNAMAQERQRSDQILKEVHEALFTHSRADIHKALVKLRALEEKEVSSLGCQCWLSINTGPNGECEKCGKVKILT